MSARARVGKSIMKIEFVSQWLSVPRLDAKHLYGERGPTFGCVHVGQARAGSLGSQCQALRRVQVCKERSTQISLTGAG
jgi:hypothetical protein